MTARRLARRFLGAMLFESLRDIFLLIGKWKRHQAVPASAAAETNSSPLYQQSNTWVDYFSPSKKGNT